VAHTRKAKKKPPDYKKEKQEWIIHMEALLKILRGEESLYDSDCWDEVNAAVGPCPLCGNKAGAHYGGLGEAFCKNDIGMNRLFDPEDAPTPEVKRKRTIWKRSNHDG
jgi:hypothetical protein